MYTSGHTKPTPFATTYYMNRFINPSKLCEMKYTNMPATMSFKEFDKKHSLPKKENINIKGNLRLMVKKDLNVVYKLWNQQQEKYKLRYKCTMEEIKHYLFPQDNVVWTYVIENEVDGKKQVTDFFSMHRLTQRCTSEGCKYERMHSGFLFYYSLTVNDYYDMVLQALWIAKEELECDAFSCQVLMDNTREYLQENLGFMCGDGRLHYYLVNWSIGGDRISSNDVGAILL